MAVEATVVNVEDTSAKVGHVDLRDTLQLLGYGGIGVLDSGGVHSWSFIQDVCAFQGV